MFKKAQPYIILFFLLAFLFPSIVKELHTVYHEDHEICNVVSDYHFHEHHEECKFCDHILPVTEVPAKSTIAFAFFQFSDYSYTLFLTEYSDSFIFSYGQLRAPPLAAQLS